MLSETPRIQKPTQRKKNTLIGQDHSASNMKLGFNSIQFLVNRPAHQLPWKLRWNYVKSYCIYQVLAYITIFSLRYLLFLTWRNNIDITLTLPSKKCMDGIVLLSSSDSDSPASEDRSTVMSVKRTWSGNLPVLCHIKETNLFLDETETSNESLSQDSTLVLHRWLWPRKPVRIWEK